LAGVGTLADRLAVKTDTSGDHHCWRGATSATGTPQVRVDGRLTTVRRVVWKLAHGPLPARVTVAACPEDPTCVRLEHLSVGRTRRTPARPFEARPRQRARRGTGTMRDVAPGVWELAVTSEGRRRYRRVRGTRDEAAAALASLVAQTGGRADTLDTLVAAYLAHLEDAGRSPTTLHRYRQLWRDWLSPTLAARNPADIGRPALERALTGMTKGGLSASSIHQAAVFLSGCFAWAHRQRTIDRNPALALRLPDGTILAPPRRR
jgi:hypothetical protein